MRIWVDMPEPMAITKDGEEDVFPFKVSWLSNQEYIYTADGKIIQAQTEFNAKETIPFSATFKLKRPTYQRKKRDFDEGEATTVKGITHPNLAPNGKTVTFQALNNIWIQEEAGTLVKICLLYTSPSPRDATLSRMPSSA